jgi:isopentenyl phosphate kinase
MDYYATQLRNKDLEVVKIGGSYLSVKATEEQVKSALISKRRAESEAAWKR